MVDLSSVRWIRILVAAVAVPVAHVSLAAVTILVYTLLTTMYGGVIAEYVDVLAAASGIWSIPVLTVLGALWASHRQEQRSAVLHGLLVGALVAIGPLFGLLGPPSLLLATLTVAMGLLGGWLTGRSNGARYQQERW